MDKFKEGEEQGRILEAIDNLKQDVDYLKKLVSDCFDALNRKNFETNKRIDNHMKWIFAITFSLFGVIFNFFVFVFK